jgi:hypothetical protein
MTDIKLEPYGRSISYSAPLPVPETLLSSDESTQTTRHEALAFGHIVAAQICELLGTDYDRRVLVGLSSTDLGLTPVIGLRRTGRHAPLRSELLALVQQAYDMVVGRG